jgi:Flp pilus assembly protein TadB
MSRRLRGHRSIEAAHETDLGRRRQSMSTVAQALRQRTEGQMNHNAGLRKAASEMMYLWAAVGVSIAVIFVLVAL